MMNNKKDNLWDFIPKHELLDSDSVFSTKSTFNAAMNAHGVYETMRFVLRLSPTKHKLVDSAANKDSGGYTADEIQAYSTYLHETVHWWQHVGSTSGLLLSLSYLGQTHGSLGHLQEVISKFGPKKSLKTWTDEVVRKDGKEGQERLRSAIIAVNNALDIEFYRYYALQPKRAASELQTRSHFESIGHGYSMAYGQLLGMLSGAVDPDFLSLPSTSEWDAEFQRLNETKHEGFYWNSPIRVPPIGLHAIYEGQARFVQLQFLNLTMKTPPSMQDWRGAGMLSGIYVSAFETFLKFSASEWPDSSSDSIVGLFLLVCDIAINPTRGFPLSIVSYEDFIDDVDVGVRFIKLSKAISERAHLKTAIKKFSRDEYIDVSEELTCALGYDHPLTALKEIVDWISSSSGLEKLMDEHKTFDFEQANLPIRVFFSHFVSFCKDKLERPEFFCWPGVWLNGDFRRDESKALWLRHLSLFMDREDKPGVYPRKWPDRDENAIKKTFEEFYTAMVAYDLTRQWILNDGPFSIDYEWLSENYSQDDAERWADDIFKKLYGVSTKDF